MKFSLKQLSSEHQDLSDGVRVEVRPRLGTATAALEAHVCARLRTWAQWKELDLHRLAFQSFCDVWWNFGRIVREICRVPCGAFA
eukprot:4992501-Amphidinium_carterae.1